MTESPRSPRDWIDTLIDTSALDALKRNLPSSDLSSLLIDVARARAADRAPSNLLNQWQSDRFVAPANVDQRTQLELDRTLFDVAREYEALELSPVAPLGACSVIAPTGQNRIVSTMRGTEVVSDPTNVLALECARRLRDAPGDTLRLATSHRCVRAQALPKGPGFSAHFKLFCIASAGHESASHDFVVGRLIEHIRFHLDAFVRLNELGYRFADPSLLLMAAPARAHLVPRIAAPFAHVRCEVRPLTQPYYDGLRFTISARMPTGEETMLCDGGAFDWLQKLLSNRKMVFVASALGSQRAAALFKN